MKTLLLLVGLSLTFAQAEEIAFTFHIHKMEPTIGEALEGRLIAGGEVAAQALAKLPDFVRQGRVEEVATLAITTPSGERAAGKSSEGTVSLPSREAVDGLEIEIDPVLENGNVNLNYYASFTTLVKGDPRERAVTTQTSGQVGQPMILCRWQIDDEWLLLTGTANAAGAEENGTPKGEVLFVESAYYDSASAAKFNRDRLASTLIPCLSGQSCRSEIVEWIDDENIIEDEQPGFRSYLTPALNDDGTLKLRAACGYIIESGGRTRLDNGDRVRRLKIRDVNEMLELKEGEPAGRRAELSGLEDVETEEDSYVAAFRFSRSSTKQ
ncbi:MAG: hypothetical protein MI807_11295 [Verrucomicrobiales bacterium]|nr:hypothetical protein [Verrucomicrobiales bacterium]